MKKDIFEAIQNDIMNSNLNEDERNKMLKNVMSLKEKKVNIMITGATGCGKSSTINALFDTEVAKVGEGTDPETTGIDRYELDNLILWDTPGLGDGAEADRRHTQDILNKLSEVDANGKAVIDLVLVILDGGTRDLGTSYDLINKVIIPNLGENKENRILVAINQADMAMKGRNWDSERNEPNEVLVEFLESKVESVKKRIYESTGVDIEPIYYSAGYKEAGKMQSRPYNLSKLLYYIVKSTPSDKRVVYANNINSDDEMWQDDDKQINYNEETRRNIFESIVAGASEGALRGAELGSTIGEIFGSKGKAVGRIIGTIAGGVLGGALGGLRWF